MRMKAMGYVRVSTDEQAREDISLDNQKVKIESYCTLHDLELVGIIEDAGKSGKDLNRDGMKTLMDTIKDRQVSAVVVYKLDRLSRKVSYTQILCTPIKKTYPLISQKFKEPLCRGAKERIRLMKKNDLKQDKNQEQVEKAKSSLEEIIREGARRLLQSAIEREIADYMESINETGGRRNIVRNGFAPERSILTGIGSISIKQPRIRDRREEKESFTSSILPRYLRRVPSLDNLIPVLYLKGVSTGDFTGALSAILGENAKGLFRQHRGDVSAGACDCLTKDKDVLFTFYDFPAEHWIHIRTTNPIESTFATVRLRTDKTRGCGTRLATLTMVFKLVLDTRKTWKKIKGYRLIPRVLEGDTFIDGEGVNEEERVA